MDINIGDKVFSHWTVAEKLGSGAYGTVYKLKRDEFGETYFSALKVIQIPPDNAYISSLKSEGMTNKDISAYLEDIAKSFMNEIKLLEELKGNTNIVSYEDHIIDTDDNELKYTIMIRMELLTPLKDRLIDNNLNEKEIAKIGIDICSALELCERKNIIHRDIKPDNIFVSSTGAYKLGDFGVARTMEKTVSAMSQKGTYTYMAPEVYLGKEYDRTVDLYSLGILLYQLLNKNRTPFLPDAPAPIKYSDREDAQKRRMSGERVPKISDISDNWNKILDKVLNPNSFERFKNASEMKKALNEILNTTQISDKNVVLEYKTTENIYKDDSKTTGPFFNNTELKENDANAVTKSTINNRNRTLLHIVFSIGVVFLSLLTFYSNGNHFFFLPFFSATIYSVAFSLILVLILGVNKFKKFIPIKYTPMMITYLIFFVSYLSEGWLNSLTGYKISDFLYYIHFYDGVIIRTLLSFLPIIVVLLAGILNTKLYSKTRSKK